MTANSARQGRDGRAGGVAAIKTRVVNLEEGRPTVAEALARLERELDRARRDGVRLLKVIHGYGSTGVGGAIKQGVHRRLATFKRNGRIAEFVPGEEWGVFHEGTRRIVEELGDPGSDPDFRNQNEGVSFLLIR